MMGAIENPRNQSGGPITTSSPSWKLFENPYFSHYHHDSPQHHHHPYNSLPPHTLLPREFTDYFSTMDRVDSPSDLDIARTLIKELRAELEFEGRIRRKAESLNKVLARELADERRGREAAEATCKRLAEEIAFKREEAERAARELQEERRMLRIAEVWREERVQMKLSEAQFVMEEKLREMEPPGCHPVLTILSLPAAGASCKSPGGGGGGRETGGSVGSTGQATQDGRPRREVENPHIKRGIKGFVEFPRAVRVRAAGNMGSSPSSGRGHSGSSLECQRAQLRILLRHRQPVSSGLTATTENLVM